MLNKSTNCGGYHYVFSISCPYLVLGPEANISLIGATSGGKGY